MVDDTHDMASAIVLVDGVAPCLAIDGKGFVDLGVDAIVALERPIERLRLDPRVSTSRIMNVQGTR